MSDTYLTSLGIGISTLLILGTIFYLRSNTKPSKPEPSRKQPRKPKKPVKILTLLERFQLALTTVNTTVRTELEPEVEKYYTDINQISPDDRLYKYNYFQEELLKELIKLDEIDLTLLDDETVKKTLKDERKIIIKHIQGLQKGLDGYKKENSGKYPKN
ncbi:hypothetical protein WICANDRAFT_76057 [Wickerhamomyces anomalus NRRL Y-366-8]|uniref:BAG domain-containing protein n=1 Tax=Wickerhamomyces anomalus (strain ATCC 58044 / CBS 1984 / NCYC 433 / NRRL Y-366-8) TaxID=683960 RepID=A0A1E3PAG2_WICAA|nr:uncharacterized protein WICANDRAFT_76057 [Wickerhamomyces anomalus NRRL Y-366-8]ODQ61867.1 hypothetical protein WICANDRAFT_76057 [Wickerhamomyces anomalus NRRL Y-366-8]